MLGALALRQRECYVAQRRLARGMSQDTLGVVRAVKVPIDCSFGVERHVRAVVALPEAGVAEHLH